MLITFSVFVVMVYSACKFDKNTLDKISGDTMTFMQSTTNGKKFVIGDINSTDRLFVARLNGTPYEMGQAYGILFKAELKNQTNKLFAYYRDNVTFLIIKIEKLFEAKLPKFIA
jgi:hypothetical protein